MTRARPPAGYPVGVDLAAERDRVLRVLERLQCWLERVERGSRLPNPAYQGAGREWGRAIPAARRPTPDPVTACPGTGGAACAGASRRDRTVRPQNERATRPHAGGQGAVQGRGAAQSGEGALYC